MVGFWGRVALPPCLCTNFLVNPSFHVPDPKNELASNVVTRAGLQESLISREADRSTGEQAPLRWT
jgi:hypothetical protein